MHVLIIRSVETPWRSLRGALLGSLLFASILATPCVAQQIVSAPGGVAAGRDITGNTFNFGLTTEQLKEATAAAVSGATGPLLDRITDISKTLGVTQDAAKRLLQIVGEDPNVPADKLADALSKVATDYKQLQVQAMATAALARDNPIAHALIEQATAEIELGHFAHAHDLLHQARQAQLAAAQKARKLREQAQAAEEAQMLGAANSTAVEAGVALTERHYAQSAELFGEAAGYAPAGHADARLRYLDRQANALYRQGDELGDNAALGASIVILRELADQGYPRDRMPLDWAAAQGELGDVLFKLGERESGTAHLEQALAAYEAALQEITRDRAPLEWAMTQSDLGAALARLGEREGGTARLELAVAAYRAAIEPVVAYYAALEQDTHDRVSWTIFATTQMNLAGALLVLGEREGNAARLEEAAVADRAALAEYTRDRAPLQWAQTQINLGNVLQTLGEREGNTARLEEAVEAYHAALDQCTRELLPLRWALAQNNLGKALWVLGARENGTERLQEAVAAYRAALQERTRERVPLDWAMTQNNLGIALKTLGERENGTARLQEAVAAYREALKEYTPDRVPLQWAMTQTNLGNALAALGEKEGGTARLKEAIVGFGAALERDPLPVDQASIQFNMGCALATLGRRSHSTGRLQAAVNAFYQAEGIFRAAGMTRWTESSGRRIVALQNEIETGPLETRASPERDAH